MLQAPKRRPRRDDELPYSERRPYLRNQPGTRAKAACTLTGIEIRRGDVVAVEYVPAHRQKPGYLEAAGNLTAAPLTLHQHQQDGAVGLVYAPPFLRFLDYDDPAAWWESDYGVERVRRGLINEGDTPGEAQRAIDAVTLYQRSRCAIERAALVYDRDFDWLSDKLDQTWRLAHRRGRMAHDA